MFRALIANLAAVENRRALIVDLVAILILIGICLAVALPRYRVGLDAGDEGALAYGAVRVLHGEIPHRDFVSVQPPLSFYATALVFKFFGASLLTLSHFGLSIYLLLPILLYAIARCLTNPVLSFATAIPICFLGVPFFNFRPFPVWQGITASLFATLFFLHATLHHRVRLALVSGIFTGASLMLRQDQGLYLAISLVVFAIALACCDDNFIFTDNFARILLFWLGGAAVVLLPLSIFYWSRSALTDMWHQLVVFPLTTYTKTSAFPFPTVDLHETLSQIVANAFFYAPPVGMVLSAVWLGQRIGRRRFGQREAILLFLLVWSALFYLQVVTRSDRNHLFITLPPFFILMGFSWYLFICALNRRRALKIFFSILAIIGVGFFLRVMSSESFQPKSDTLQLVDLPAGRVYTENGAWLSEFIRGVQRYVPTNRTILALPYQPMFYFLCERKNPTRWNCLWPGDQTAEEHLKLVEEAKSDPPAVVFITDEDKMSLYAPEIFDYIHAGFHRTGQFGSVTVYFPNGSKP